MASYTSQIFAQGGGPLIPSFPMGVAEQQRDMQFPRAAEVESLAHELLFVEPQEQQDISPRVFDPIVLVNTVGARGHPLQLYK